MCFPLIEQLWRLCQTTLGLLFYLRPMQDPTLRSIRQDLHRKPMVQRAWAPCSQSALHAHHLRFAVHIDMGVVSVHTHVGRHRQVAYPCSQACPGLTWYDCMDSTVASTLRQALRTINLHVWLASAGRGST